MNRQQTITKGQSCDWKSVETESKKQSRKSIIYRHKGSCQWKGIKTEAYKSQELKGESGKWSKIIRRVLIGDNVDTKFHLRYFEIAPGGQSSFEKHRHEHVVVVIRGNGKVFLNKKHHRISFLDIVYISPDTPHQFLNPFNEPFGFLCAVPAKRDRPIVI